MQSTLIHDENTGILYRRWAAPSANTVALLIHGLGAHTGRWEALATFLAEKNIASYAIELKGFGETDTLKGHINSFTTYFTDLKELSGVIAREYPDKELFLCGESLGGLLAFLLATMLPSRFAGLICISPAFKSTLRFSTWDYLKFYTARVCAPYKQFIMPFTAAMCTRDTEYQARIATDPREHFLATATLLANIAFGQLQAQRAKRKLTVPTLFLLSGSDMIVNTKTSHTLFENLALTDKKLIEYPRMHHALSVDLEKENVFTDLHQWLTSHTT